MSELPPDVAELLSRARRGQIDPDADVRERVRQGVASALIASAVVTTVVHAGAQAGAKGFLTSALVGKLAAGALACTVVLGVVVAPRIAPSPPRAGIADRATAPVTMRESPRRTVAASARVVSADDSLPGDDGDESSESEEPGLQQPAAVLGSRARTVPMGPSTPVSSLRAELQLLARAEHVLERDGAKEALALLTQHGARFPAPRLAEEREGLMLLARCMLDPRSAAADAARFVTGAQGAVLRTRVEHACRRAPPSEGTKGGELP